MKTITFKIHSLIRFKLELIDYPRLSSNISWVQRGIDLMRQYLPGMLRCLSRERVLGNLNQYLIVFETKKQRDPHQVKTAFKVWVQKEKMKRLVLVILEALVIPFTGILALLPGPNVFFYVPALLLYFHFKTWVGLHRTDVDELSIHVKTDTPKLGT